jgi:hypothetical protein
MLFAKLSEHHTLRCFFDGVSGSTFDFRLIDGKGGRGGIVQAVLRGKSSNIARNASRRPDSSMKLNHGVRFILICPRISGSPAIIEVMYDEGILAESRWIQ